MSKKDKKKAMGIDARIGTRIENKQHRQATYAANNGRKNKGKKYIKARRVATRQKTRVEKDEKHMVHGDIYIKQR